MSSETSKRHKKAILQKVKNPGPISDLAGHILTNNHVIVDRILNYLPVVELISKQTVCKFWKDSTIRILKTRQSPFHFYHYVIEVNEEESVARQPSTHTKRQKFFQKPISDLTSYYVLQMEQIFLQWRTTWHVIPEVLLLISKVDLSPHLHCMDTFLRFKAFLYEHIPKSSTLILIRDSVNLHEKANVYIHNNHLFFPKDTCSGVFSWSKKNWRSEEIGRDLIQGVDQYLADNADARLIVIFFNWDVTLEPIYQMEQDLFTLLSDYVGRLSDMSVLGCCTMYPFSLSLQNVGGIGGRKIIDSEFTVNPMFVALAFSMNTFVASVTVDEDIDTRGGLYDKLRLLHESVPAKVLSSSSTYGIMITDLMRTSAGKWYSEYQTDSFETTAFKQVFPNMPLAFSLCGNAQIGTDYNLNPPRDARFVDVDEEPTIHHIWTTIFAIVNIDVG